MAESTGTTALTGTSAEDQAVIDGILGGEQSEEVEDAAESEQKPGPTTEAPETEDAEEEAEETEEAADEEADAEEADGEGEEADEESDLTLTEGDRDYSQEAYEKAAAFYSKKLKVQFDPNDAKDRVTLSRLLKDREALASQREELEAAKATGKKADEAKTEEVKTAEETETRAAPTPEQIEQGLKTIYDLAKTRNVPAVAMHNANRLVKALWPNEEIKLTPEQANEINSTFHGMFLQALDDALPFLFQGVHNNLNADPVWSVAKQEAIRERAFEHIEKTKGAEFYASMETLALDGTLKKVISDNPKLFANFRADKDPIANEAAKLELAFKIARGDKTVQQVTKAVETGKKQATDRAKKVAAGRVGAGTPKSGFKPGQAEGSEFVRNLTQGGGSKFGAAVKSQLHK